MNAPTRRYSVTSFRADGTPVTLASDHDDRDSVHALRDALIDPDALTGAIVRILVTDNLDRIVFDWQFGKGIVWPDDCPEFALTTDELQERHRL